jgi:hypothetical protein
LTLISTDHDLPDSRIAADQPATGKEVPASALRIGRSEREPGSQKG